MRTASFIFLALALGACATRPAALQPVAPPKEVDVPVAVSCVPADYPAPPADPAPVSAVKGAAPAEGLRDLAEFWTVVGPRWRADEQVLAACRTAAPAPKPP